jgi:hypothetical protein
MTARRDRLIEDRRWWGMDSLGDVLGRSMSRMSPPRSPTRHHGSDVDAEVARLQKQNFNLKLRIYYLEEVRPLPLVVVLRRHRQPSISVI